MCGRLTLTTATIAGRLEFAEASGEMADAWRGPRYNIAPSHLLPVVRLDPDTGGRRLDLLRCGLVPSWAADVSVGYKMINARAETLAEKPSFRSAFESRRCLIVADGFYEWRVVGKGKVPHHVRMRSGKPFAVAGLWESWPKSDPPLETCTVITTTPNALMVPIHDRMPAIIHPEAYDFWLDLATKHMDALAGLLEPYPAESMIAYPVSSMVNKPGNDRPGCIEPAA